MTTRKKMIKSIAIYGLAVCGMIAGHFIDKEIYKEKIKKMYAPRILIDDLNLDPIPDIVLQNEDGEIFFYLGGRTGFRHVTREELLEYMGEKDEEEEKMEKQQRLKENSLENKFRGI